MRAARKLAPPGLYWWEEPTTREREQPANAVALQCPIRVATGEMYDPKAYLNIFQDGWEKRLGRQPADKP